MFLKQFKIYVGYGPKCSAFGYPTFCSIRRSHTTWLLTILFFCSCVLANLIKLKSTFRFTWLKFISSNNSSVLYYDSCTYLLTPWSTVLLEKLTGFQFVKKFPAFYGTRRFTTAFTSARHLSLSWASSIQSVPRHPNSRGSILILSTHVHLSLLSGLLHSGFPTKHLYTHLFSPCVLHALPISSRFYHPNNIGWGIQIIKLITM